jgi:methenyltetrahydrofolate cyclohydrolase
VTNHEPPTTNHPPPTTNRSYGSMALADLLDAFAANDPVPGGGSAAALAGALGASLLIMVAGLPKTRTGAPEEAADLAEASARLRPLRDMLISLIDQDSDAYSGVLAAMRQPKGTGDEQQARRAAIDAAMQGATEVPLETMRCCQQALRGAVVVATHGSQVAATDSGAAIELLLAGLRCAAMNVDVNVKSASDAAFAARVTAERTELARDAEADAGRARERLKLD